MKDYKAKDYTILLAGFLSALKLFLASLGYDIIKEETINSLVAMIAFSISLYAIWKNTYVSKKSQEQRKVLEENKLIK